MSLVLPGIVDTDFIRWTGTPVRFKAGEKVGNAVVYSAEQVAEQVVNLMDNPVPELYIPSSAAEFAKQYYRTSAPSNQGWHSADRSRVQWKDVDRPRPVRRGAEGRPQVSRSAPGRGRGCCGGCGQRGWSQSLSRGHPLSPRSDPSRLRRASIPPGTGCRAG